MNPIAARRRRIVLLAGIGPVLVTAALAVYRPGAFLRLDNTVYDVMLRSAHLTPPTDQVAIVDVDERSLSTVGQWPWRRDVVATLIDRLRDIGAALVALDMVFAEPDRQVPVETAGGPGGSGLQNPDDVLAATLREGRVLLGYGLTFDDRPVRPSACVLHPVALALLQPDGETNATPFFTATGAVCNLPSLAHAAGASGFMNAAPDVDGILRRVPLVAELGGRLYPSLAVAAVASVTKAQHFALRVVSANDSTLSIDDRHVPVDARSNLLVRPRGRKRTFPYVSAADVLSRDPAADTLRGRIVFVGTTALGTREVVATPLDTLFAGVEVQATVADNLLRQDFIRRSALSRLAEVTAVLVLGVTVAALFATTGLVSGLLGGLLGCAALWWGGIWLLSNPGILVSPLFPCLGIASSLAATTIARFGVERRRAERAGRERSEARKLMVQTLLSLTEVRDAETGRHSLRTQRYARLLAEQLSTNPAFRQYLTRQRVDLLASLAPLHDIGKVGIPDHILNKPGALTPDELAEMRRHPTLGRDVIIRAEQRVGVRDDETLAMAKDIVYSHHERWDGKGYPEGLHGSEIPVAGRIMAVVDVYDAATTRTLYRPLLSHEAVERIIVDGKGTHFDPDVVDAFVAVAPLFRQLRETTAEPAETESALSR